MTPANLVSPVARIAAAVTAAATVTATRNNTTRSTSCRGSSNLLARSLRARERSLEASDHFPREPLFISLPRTIANPFGILGEPSVRRCHDARKPSLVREKGKRRKSGSPTIRCQKEYSARGTETGSGSGPAVREEGRIDSRRGRRGGGGRTERERAGSSSDTIPGDTRAGASVYRARTTTELQPPTEQRVFLRSPRTDSVFANFGSQFSLGSSAQPFGLRRSLGQTANRIAEIISPILSSSFWRTVASPGGTW